MRRKASILLSIIIIFGAMFTCSENIQAQGLDNTYKAENDKQSNDNSCVTHDWIYHNGEAITTNIYNADGTSRYCLHCSLCKDKANYTILAEQKPWKTDDAGKGNAYWEWYENNGYTDTGIAEQWHLIKAQCNGKRAGGALPTTYKKPAYWECSKCHAKKTDDNSKDLNSDIGQGCDIYDINGNYIGKANNETYQNINRYLWQNGQTAKYFTKSEFIDTCVESSGDDGKNKESISGGDGKGTNSSNGSNGSSGTGQWKKNSKGWWCEYSDGTYPKSTWLLIEGKWYYFCSDGYMDYSEYRDGYWLNSDGAWDERYSGGHWMGSDNDGWWYTDNTGWYPKNMWLWVNGKNYHFDSEGWCTNPY